MSTARETFDSSIKDAVELLDHFNAINILPPPPNAEVPVTCTQNPYQSI